MKASSSSNRRAPVESPDYSTKLSVLWNNSLPDRGVCQFHTRDNIFDALEETQRMAKQKFRPTRPGGFSGAKATIRYVEVLKKTP